MELLPIEKYISSIVLYIQNICRLHSSTLYILSLLLKTWYWTKHACAFKKHCKAFSEHVLRKGSLIHCPLPRTFMPIIPGISHYLQIGIIIHTHTLSLPPKNTIVKRRCLELQFTSVVEGGKILSRQIKNVKLTVYNTLSSTQQQSACKSKQNIAWHSNIPSKSQNYDSPLTDRNVNTIFIVYKSVLSSILFKGFPLLMWTPL